jgi:hypothetical protein
VFSAEMLTSRTGATSGADDGTEVGGAPAAVGPPSDPHADKVLSARTQSAEIASWFFIASLSLVA